MCKLKMIVIIMDVMDEKLLYKSFIDYNDV